MTSSSDRTAPDGPARAVTANTGESNEDSAPPSVPSSPSADTRGADGTSTSEGPARPTKHLPDDDGGEDHEKQGAKSGHEQPAPGSRVDDEHDGHGDKTMTRQE